MSDRLHALVNDTPLIFFQLEDVALSFHDVPLRSPHLALSLISKFLTLIENNSRHVRLYEHVFYVHEELQQKRSNQMFFSEEFPNHLLAWSSELRSQYILAESFYLTGALDGLERYSDALLNQGDAPNGPHDSAFLGCFKGSMNQLSYDLSQLSEVGLWEISYAANELDSMTQEASVSLDLSLSTGLSKSDLSSKLKGQWRWSDKTNKGRDDFLEDESSFRGGDVAVSLRCLAMEREQWRHTPSIMDVYHRLESQVLASSVLLEQLYQCDVGGSLRVIADILTHSDKQQNPAQITLVNGSVVARTEAEWRRYELALPSLPAFKITSEYGTAIVPCYAVVSVDHVECVAAHLALGDGQWCQVDTLDTNVHPIYVMCGEKPLALHASNVERVYAVPLRVQRLPADISNVWSVRGELFPEPFLPSGRLDGLIEAIHTADDFGKTPVRGKTQTQKVQCYRDHDGTRLAIASKFIEAVVVSERATLFRDRFLLYRDELLIIGNTEKLTQQGIFIVIRMDSVSYALFCENVESVEIEPVQESVCCDVNESLVWVDSWLSGESQNVRIMSEACVSAIYSKLLEAI
ncbi:hypothetical protein DN730_12985 [Marinomonas piezotolerans]|uniref:Uncharacterized protein n=1 Tax=Marinomonas piezotolerans TaxID=2213058 RepID=A0A370U7B8_9GAMM|nr:hypothetical protein [Marinomonas piezotolerans]RDL43655.1 hypothetical protein DN730_12985 [Marinomonas piezotolerans]